jgi:hypothetical protein
MSQVFKKVIPKHFLFEFLDAIGCQKTDKFYIVDVTAFKRAVYNNLLEVFIHNIKDYYYTSKLHYVDMSHMNHNKFNTIIRQVCKCNNISFSKFIKYDKSTYSVVYKVHYGDDGDNNDNIDYPENYDNIYSKT